MRRGRCRRLLRGLLQRKLTRVGQVLGMEVVKKLVTQVAQDPRLLVPVREAIVALEPSLLRLAPRIAARLHRKRMEPFA